MKKKERRKKKKELEKSKKESLRKEREENIISKSKNSKKIYKTKIIPKKDDNKIITMINPIDYYYLSKHPELVIKGNHSNPPKKKRGNNILMQNNLSNLNINNNIHNINNNENKSESMEQLKKKEIIKKVKEIMAYNDQELNNLEYELALKYDKRTFSEYYCSLIKTKNIFIFSFIYNNDYNSKVIKIDLFFISFIIYFTVNALFFNDNTIHKIYEDKGKFQILYQLPKIVYSSLISMALNILLKLLALSESDILLLKGKKTKKNLDKKEEDLYNKLNIKFLLFFIISTIFLLFFWYYLSMFGAIYKNTQLHLIKDTLISFGLSFFYPFGLYLFPGLFRIPALSNEKNKRKYLYSIGKLLQML